MLTDDQCNEFRRLSLNLKDMLRAIHNDGKRVALQEAIEKFEAWEPKMRGAVAVLLLMINELENTE